MTDVKRDFPAGTVFADQYEVLSSLGGGGYGQVYEAKQRSTGQRVALKVIHRASGDAAQRESSEARFLREMQLCARLHHPNVVQLIDSGQSGDRLFSVFALVPGQNLQQLLKREGPLHPQEAMHLMAQVLDGLSAAHNLGVVHRDLKPANIMISATGARRNALILDFGIGGFAAKPFTTELASITATAEFLGTPLYAAPEQLKGEPPSLRSDLYAWGLVFLETLTGEAAMRAPSISAIVARQLSSDEVPLPAALKHHPLGRLLRQVLVKEVEHRNVAADELLGQLLACDVADLARGQLSTVNLRARAPELAEDTTSSSTPQAERRQVTALCCSLSFAEGQDEVPLELFDRRMRHMQVVCREIAGRFGGHVASIVGDLATIYFGYPIASEDDPRRAVRAALALLDDIERQAAEVHQRGEAGVPTIGLGIATGLVIARGRGPAFGRHAPAVSGCAPHLAARLSAEARPGTILVSADTEALLRRHVALQPAGEQRVLGFERPVVTFTVEAQDSPSSSLLLGYGAEIPMVGRSQELELLRERWRQVCAGAGRFILVKGEPGIGKSRLVAELVREVAAASHGWLECRCAPADQHRDLAPLIDLLLRLLNLKPGEEAQQGAQRLERLLKTYELPLPEQLPLFSGLLGLPLLPGYSAPELDPARQRQLTLDALVGFFVEAAARTPLLLVVEDLHWADPTTLELLEHLMREGAEESLCLVCTARQEATPSRSLPDLLEIQLGRLDLPQVAELVQGLSGGKAIPAAVCEMIYQRTDGVSLFVEELGRSLLASGALAERDGALTLVRSIAELEVPETLRNLLMARLDSSGGAKETAQVAAALGREFDVAILSAAAVAGERVAGDLETLARADIVRHRRRRGRMAYYFKHALIRDLAYESMLSERRAAVHASIARAIEQQFPALVEQRPDLLAQHCAAAGQHEAAIGHAIKAGALALRRSANQEALAHVEGARPWLQGVVSSERRAELELGLIGVANPARTGLQGWGDPQIKANIDRVGALVEQLPGSPHAAQALSGLVLYYTLQAQVPDARAAVNKLVALAEQTGDELQRMLAHGMAGTVEISEGHYLAARQSLELSLELYDVERHRGLAFALGQDPAVQNRAHLSFVLGMMGHLDQALACVGSAREHADALQHAHSRGLARMFTTMAHAVRGEPERCAAVAQETLALADEHGLMTIKAYAALLAGWGLGNPQMMRQILDGMQAANVMVGVPLYWGLYSSCLARAGDLVGACEAAERAHQSACRSGEEQYLAAVLRLEGEHLLARDPRATDAAEALFREAMLLARKQGAKLPELQATVAICRLLQRQGSSEQAHGLLSDCYGWFTEGLATPILQEARALLEQLA